jgi:serine phosphatase RsbU (regulator of sigma subunit)
MLELKDLIHLPQLEPILDQFVADGPGLSLVAGLDPRPLLGTAAPDGFLPSGRAAFFRILVRQILAAEDRAQVAIVATSREQVRVSRSFRHRTHLHLVHPEETYGQVVLDAAARRPDLLVIDTLTAESAPAAAEAAANGLRVLSQLDTLYCGARVAQHLLDLGVRRAGLTSLHWVITVQRLATLCPHCRRPAQPSQDQLDELVRRYAHLAEAMEAATFYDAAGCRRCGQRGREGEVAAFDVYHTTAGGPNPMQPSSLLPLEEYVLGLAVRGYLSLEDLLHLEAGQLRCAYSLFLASERALAERTHELERKRVELEAANRVLLQRTEALVSLESIGQALATSAGLDQLAGQLCRGARDLCGADRSLLYLLHPEQGVAEIVSECGWDPSLLRQPLSADLVLGDGIDAQPSTFNRWPPGVPHRPTDVTALALRAGLRVLLVAQDQPVGLMIVQSSQKARFTPGEVALLQTFASQAAVAIQRARLVHALQDKIVQLEAAQAELLIKERLEHELELARQVQKSVLPQVFPLLPGYAFGARSQPARRVGGDFYDVFLLDAERFVVVVGDVSGKGMPAALYMAQTHSLLRAEGRREDSPQAVLANVHRLLQQLGRSLMFVTVFYGLVDVPARRLTYARAGHDRPLLLRRGQVQPLGGEGTMIGFPDMADLHLSEEQVDLKPGDRLVLYTDGLIDAVTPDGHPFGLHRLVSWLGSHADLSPEDLCAATFAELEAYQATAEQYDDMTLLTMGLA